MWFWNRIEVYCGFSLSEFSELRDILAYKGIKYSYRLVNQNTSTRRYGVLGLNTRMETQYYLYVHKKDYDNAIHYLHTMKTM